MNKTQEFCIIVGKKIKYYRSIRKLTQVELAKKINISAGQLGKIENAKTDFYLEVLLKICKALDVTPKDLLDQS